MKPGPSVHRLHDGSVIVARRVGRAFAPKGRPLAAVLRCGAALWASGHVLDLLHQSPLWIVGGTCTWCWAAWRAEPDEEQVAADKAQAVDAVKSTPTAEHLRELIGDRNGVLLSELLAVWQRHGWVGQIPAAELGRQLAAHGIPVRASLKVAGAVGPGVHRDDLPAVAEPLPEAALADAG